MAKSNRERVGDGLAILREGLIPWVEERLHSKFGSDWLSVVNQGLKHPMDPAPNHSAKWESSILLYVINDYWGTTFRYSELDRGHRSMVNELIDVRNKWAHEEPFKTDDAYRALDTMWRLLDATGQRSLSVALERIRDEAMRDRMDERSRRDVRKIELAEGQSNEGLRPWRELVTPHPDVRSNSFRKAEFAADLSAVHAGIASNEYADPEAFFQRTFLTEGLSTLLMSALKRMNNIGGDPVIQLQTNFGGGKTHSMLALYHLFSKISPSKLAGIDGLLDSAGVKKAPDAARAVLVGTSLSVNQPRKIDDSVTLHTLWGHMAWQLGEARGKAHEVYELVRRSDEAGTNPGSKVLENVFKACGACLILIDEWVAFLRDLRDENPLSAGSRTANLTFAQSLTEAARNAPATLLVTSLPLSERSKEHPDSRKDDVEIGGARGREIVKELEPIVGRMESSWRPATAEEGFEIVRRRLFEPIAPENQREIDKVVEAYHLYYQKNGSDFPKSVSSGQDYKRLMGRAYPIHPELFERLYKEWSSLRNFQRTRGVLRLMAGVIHTLWANNDQSLMIQASGLPFDDQTIKGEVQNYLEDSWEPVIDSDIDGNSSVAREIDNENDRLGRHSACRRVARAILMATAPTHTKIESSKRAVQGVEFERIALACAQPGESPEVFMDALRRMAMKSRYLYQENQRYWYAPQPTVARLAEDIAEEVEIEEVHHYIEGMLSTHAKKRAVFSAVHVAPKESAEIPDDQSLRLVILGANQTFAKKKDTCSAIETAKSFLTNRGASPRVNKNMLVFMAANEVDIPSVIPAVRSAIAWGKVLAEKEKHNLDHQAMRQAETRLSDAEKTARLRIEAAWAWALTPWQNGAGGDLTFESVQLGSSDALIENLANKLTSKSMLYPTIGGSTLEHDCKEVLWAKGEVLKVSELWEYLCRYPYLPRLTKVDVLLKAINEGAGEATLISGQNQHWMVADSYDLDADRFIGLKERQGHARDDGKCVIVKYEHGLTYLPKPVPDDGSQSTLGGATVVGGAKSGDSGSTKSKPVPSLPKRYFGTLELAGKDTLRLSKLAGQVSEQIIAKLENASGAEIVVRFDIEATAESGFDKAIQDGVKEDASTLKFKQSDFT